MGQTDKPSGRRFDSDSVFVNYYPRVYPKYKPGQRPEEKEQEYHSSIDFPAEIKLKEFLKMGELFREQIEAVRAIPDKDERNAMKRKLLGVATICGTFYTRDRSVPLGKKIKHYNSLIALDFDYIDDLDEAKRSIVALPDLPLPFDDKIVYNFHCYEPILFTHQGAQWIKNMPADLRIGFPGNADEYRQIMNQLQLPVGDIFKMAKNAETADYELFDNLFSNAAALAEQRGAALYCGEYGVIDRAACADTAAWYHAIHQAFEKYGIGRAAWSYKGMDFGISDAKEPELCEKIVSLL